MKKIMMVAAMAAALASCGAGGKKNAETAVANQPVIVEAGTHEPDSVGYIVRVGDVAPEMELELTDGQKVKLSDLRGKVVMLQFTASWCGVCRKDRDEPVETVKDFAEKTGVTYPLALDPGADHFAKYAERKAGITRNVLIDKEGKIVMLTRLYNEEEFAALCKKIDEMLAQ